MPGTPLMLWIHSLYKWVQKNGGVTGSGGPLGGHDLGPKAWLEHETGAA